MKKTVVDLFERPLEVKMRNSHEVLGRSYIAPSETNPYYEALSLLMLLIPFMTNSMLLRIKGFSQFSSYMEIILQYTKAIGGLAKDLAKRLAESYGLANPEFCKEWPSQFRMNKYHFEPKSVKKLGVQAHTDSSFLTILHDDENVGGLEVVDRSSRRFFLPINPLPNTLAINLGGHGYDME
ncbi:unnamed protein product [Cochlearia groenlandica]